MKNMLKSQQIAYLDDEFLRANLLKNEFLEKRGIKIRNFKFNEFIAS